MAKAQERPGIDAVMAHHAYDGGPVAPPVRGANAACGIQIDIQGAGHGRCHGPVDGLENGSGRSEEHTSELQSLMRISYAVFCLKKKKVIAATLHTTSQISHH